MKGIEAFKRGTARLIHADADTKVAILFAATFFIGVWYSLPMLNVISDVWSFSGGVLRAIEAHSILPGWGVPYGTLTFYLNYVATLVVLPFLLAYFHFHLEVLKSALISYPAYIYWLPRATSAFVAALTFLFVYQELKQYVADFWYRYAISILTFGSVLSVFMIRSGKQWVLSTMLATLSFLFLARIFAAKSDSEKDTRRAMFLAIFTACAAFANLPLAGFFLICVPVLLWHFRNESAELWRIVRYSIYGGGILLATLVINFQNIVSQVADIFGGKGYHPLFATAVSGDPTPHISFVQSLATHGIQLGIVAAPIVLLLIAARIYGIKNKPLLFLSLTYGLGYFLILSFVATWVGDLGMYLRYQFPLIFFLLYLLAALNPPSRVISYLAIALGFLLYFHSVFLLSVPSTYNQALVYVETLGASSAIIYNHVSELELPMNKNSYALYDAFHCATKCKNIMNGTGTTDFQPLVITRFSTSTTSTSSKVYVITNTRDDLCGEPLQKFGDVKNDGEYFDIEHNLGRLDKSEFYTLHELGKNIYVYDALQCSQLPPFETVSSTDVSETQ